MPKIRIKPKDRAKKTYTKVVTKKSGKTKTKNISAKKYERKLKSAIKSEVKGKRRKVTSTTTTTTNRKPANTTTKKQVISKKNDKGRKKTFVATSTKKATAKDVANARLRKKMIERNKRKVALKRKRVPKAVTTTRIRKKPRLL